MVLLKHDFRKWKLIYNGKKDQWLPGNGAGRARGIDYKGAQENFQG